MVWFFKKREDTETHRKIEVLHSSVSSSFQNIKRDISTVGLWLSHLKESDHHQNKRIENIENQLAHILRRLEHHENQLSSHSVSIESLALPQADYEYEEEVAEEQPSIKLPNALNNVSPDQMIAGLTDTQKLMFIRLISLQRERGGWVPLKSLAEELYPNKQYNDVRSTVSEYLTLLADWGLVTKKRTGKQSFVQVTEKGREVISQLNNNSKKQQKIPIKRK